MTTDEVLVFVWCETNPHLWRCCSHQKLALVGLRTLFSDSLQRLGVPPREKGRTLCQCGHTWIPTTTTFGREFEPNSSQLGLRRDVWRPKVDSSFPSLDSDPAVDQERDLQLVSRGPARKMRSLLGPAVTDHHGWRRSFL